MFFRAEQQQSHTKTIAKNCNRSAFKITFKGTPERSTSLCTVELIGMWNAFFIGNEFHRTSGLEQKLDIHRHHGGRSCRPVKEK